METKSTSKSFNLTITADHLVSTDPNFDENSNLGDISGFKPMNVWFQGVDGTKKYEEGQKYDNNMLPRLVCQIFGEQLAQNLSKEEREVFPICRQKSGEFLCGIYDSVDGFRFRYKNCKFVDYPFKQDHFVFFSEEIFSTLALAQECLKRFGKPGEKFVLTYREALQNESTEEIKNGSMKVESEAKKNFSQPVNYKISYSPILLKAKNLIFHGAPGTGKTFLARQIAADIISCGRTCVFEDLSNEEKKQMKLVQFHPSYDYTDFVEGLRPKINDDGSMGFELQDGIFKKFVDRAKFAARVREDLQNSSKSEKIVTTELFVQEAINDFFSDIEFGITEFEIAHGNKFFITGVTDRNIYISIPQNEKVKKLVLNTDEVIKMLESGREFKQVKDITNFFGKTFATQQFSYDFAIYKEIKTRMKKASRSQIEQEAEKKYVFIIDEINRGEISKIFGELFFAIDPEYRGVGLISTQYANLHTNPSEKFYVPENVYIIGTMNDIDRSVDSFDFAMRRRFCFINIKAKDTAANILNSLDEKLRKEAQSRMENLNQVIASVEDLNENYQIGAAYFRKLKDISFDELWENHLCPLLSAYVQGMREEKDIMKRFIEAYRHSKTGQGDKDGTDSN